MEAKVINPINGARNVDELVNPIKLLSVADFNPDDYPDPGFFWEGVLPFGTINLLAGPTGVGKTSFALQLASWGLFGNGGSEFAKLDAVFYADFETRPRELIPLNSLIDQFRPKNFYIAHVDPPSHTLSVNVRFMSYTEGLVKQLENFFSHHTAGKSLV
jgi:DNA polymerase III delta prime subunit